MSISRNNGRFSHGGQIVRLFSRFMMSTNNRMGVVLSDVHLNPDYVTAPDWQHGWG